MMRQIKTQELLLTLLLASLFWYIIFGLKIFNFWLSMSVAATSLAVLSICFSSLPITKAQCSWQGAWLGIASAGLLYVLFLSGNALAVSLFSFAKGEIVSIYDIKTQGQAVFIAFILFFITSPGEELFWRGYVQRWAMEKFGKNTGWLLGSGIYAAVHIFSGNLMLIGAALVAGLFWGYIYQRSGSLFITIISHAVWTVSIFVLWPIS